MNASISEVRQALQSFLYMDQLNFYSIDAVAAEADILGDLALLNVIGDGAEVPLTDGPELLKFLRTRTVNNVIFIATAGAPAVRPRVGMKHEPEAFEAKQELLESAAIIMDHHHKVFSIGTPFVMTLPSDAALLEAARVLHIRQEWKAEQQAAAPVVLSEFDLRTSYGARSAVAWYFTNVLQRHDFTKYINNTLAADFACALAPSLLAGVSAPAAQAVERGEVLVTVSGFTGSGKSAIAGEIEIMCRALGLQVEWPDSDSEKHMTHADWIAALEQYKPRVRIVECNVPHSVVKGQDK